MSWGLSGHTLVPGPHPDGGDGHKPLGRWPGKGTNGAPTATRVLAEGGVGSPCAGQKLRRVELGFLLRPSPVPICLENWDLGPLDGDNQTRLGAMWGSNRYRGSPRPASDHTFAAPKAVWMRLGGAKMSTVERFLGATGWIFGLSTLKIGGGGGVSTQLGTLWLGNLHLPPK